MSVYNSSEAKARFAELLDLAEKGEEVVIARYGRPVVRMVPALRTDVDRSALLGALKTSGWVADGFDDPLPEAFWTAPVSPAS